MEQLTGQDAADPDTDLVYLGNGRYFDPLLCLALQPNPLGGAPTVPQSLNRYAATSLGAPGVAEGAGSSLSGVAIASYVVGFGKSLGQEFAAARDMGIFGKDVVRYAGNSLIAFEASASSLVANRSLIEAKGGVFVESIEGIHRTLKNGGLSGFTFRTDLFRYKGTLDEVTELATSLRSTGSLVQSGFYQARTGVHLSEIEIGRAARFSEFGKIIIGFGGDAILTGVFQYADDLSNPYFTPKQRFARTTVAGIGGGILSTFGGSLGGSLGCGPYAPLCAAGGGLAGALIWGFGIQPLVFDNIPGFAPPPRDLQPLN